MILVTGGAGFIGSNLVASLARSGLRVVVCDRLGSESKWRNLAKHELCELVAPGRLDEYLERKAADLDYVFHLGAVSSTLESDADLVVETNLTLSQQIWLTCTEQGVPLVYASSAATYGDGAEGFDDDGSVEALAALGPLNVYGWSKHLFDRWVARELIEGRPHPPQWAGLKFFNVYGPNEYHKGPMRSVVAKAYPTAATGKPVTLFRSANPDYPHGGQMRDFVYVRDCVDVMVWLRDHPNVNGLFNVGTGWARTWMELVSTLYTSVGRDLTVAWKDPPAELRGRYQYFTQAQMGRLRAAGYDRPFTSVEDGVKDYVERYLATDDPFL